MIEAILQALSVFVSPITWFLMLVMMFFGLLIGILPGINIMAGVALILPFVLMLNNVPLACVLLRCMGGAGGLAGSVTAIMINVPGESSSVATLLDGYPMTKKGEGPRAIGAAAWAQLSAHWIAVLFAILIIPLVIVIVKACGSAEQWAMVLVGVTFVGVLGQRGSPLKGLMSGMLGFLLGFIGYQFNCGIPRFNFGSGFLYNGFTFVTIILALFATPGLIEMAVTGGIVAKDVQMPRGRAMWGQVWQGCLDVFRHFRLWVICVISGFIVGILPALGSSTAIWFGYGQAAKFSKHPELFGTGIVEGVIGPEACKGACGPGDLLTTVAFGIPGSTIMVILLGAFVMLGITPGPGMLIEHLDLVMLLYLVPVIAGIIGTIIVFSLLRPMMKIVELKAAYLIAVIWIFIVLGVFANNTEMLELVVLAVFSVLGYFMRKYGYSLPCLSLSFVLSKIFERSFFTSIAAYGPAFLLRPIVLGLLILCVYVAFSGPLTKIVRKALRRLPASRGG